MHVLITGGTGFIGSRLALAALKQGHRVRVFTQANNAAEEANGRLLKSQGADLLFGSVTDADAVHKAVAGIDVVFHLAAAQHEANVPDQRFWDVNVTGTKNMLEASRGAGVRRFVHGSTIGVYGGGRGVTVREDSPLAPSNIYGRTKLAGERLVQDYQDNLPVVIVRITETYGPGDRRLLKLFKGVQSGKFFIVGSGKNLHHPIFIDDLIDGLQKAATLETAVGKTFLLAGPEPLSTRAMVDAVAEALEIDAPRWRLPLWPLWLAAVGMEKTLTPLGIQPPLHRRRLNFFVLSFAFSGREAESAIGFRPKVGFAEGARRTAQWYREQGLLE